MPCCGLHKSSVLQAQVVLCVRGLRSRASDEERSLSHKRVYAGRLLREVVLRDSGQALRKQRRAGVAKALSPARMFKEGLLQTQNVQRFRLSGRRKVAEEKYLQRTRRLRPRLLLHSQKMRR